MNLKTFIVCLDKNNSLDISKKIIELNDELSIVPEFTTNIDYKGKLNENYIYYLDVNTTNLAFKNNALLYIKTDNYISNGISIDDFYNNDICFMTIEEFNLIPNTVFKNQDILIVWVDLKKHNCITNNDLIETKYFNSFLLNNNIPYMYFLNNEEYIHQVIIDYIEGDEETRNMLLNENN